MSEDTTNTPQPAAPQPNNDSTGAAQPLDPPAAGQSDDKPTAPNEIQNPEAYWRAQAEKSERLKNKFASQIESLQGQVQALQESQQKSVIDAISALEKQFAEQQAELTAELAKAQEAAKAESLNALRAKYIAANRLPDEMAPLLQGDDEETIKASAELLAKHLGDRNALASIRTVNPAKDGQAAPYKPRWANQDTFGKGGVTIGDN